MSLRSKSLLSQSILARVLAVVLAANTLIALCALLYFSQSLSSNRQYHALTSVQMVNALEAEDILNRFKTQVQEWKNVLLRGTDEAQRIRYWGQFQQQEAAIQQALDRLLPRLRDDDARELMTQFRIAHQLMGDAYRDGFEAFTRANYNHRIGDQAVQGIDRAPAQLIDQATVRIRELAQAEVVALNESVSRSALLTGALMLFSIVAGTLLCLLMLSRSVVHPVRTLTAQLHKLSEGNLSDPVTLQRSDELGRLADAARNLHKFLADTGTLLTRFADQLSGTSHGLRENAHMVDHHSEQSHQRIELIATAMNEMSATAEDVARHAAGVSAETREATAEVDLADRRAQEAAEKMERLSNQILQSAQTVEQLASNGRKVSEVMNLIREVAEQTNLLALNAAIEAARAGEAGRGFAVVADEVRTLATRTREATVQIDAIIDTIDRGSIDATEFMQASEIVAGETSEAVGAVRQALATINERVREINDAILHVATAAEEQTSVSDDILRNVVEVTDIAGQMRSSAEENLARIPELEAMARDANQLASRIRR